MLRLCLMMTLCLALCSCGSGSGNGVTVTGKVTLDGAPLTRGQVVLDFPDQGTQRVGGLNEKGEFEIADVPVGNARAAVRTSHIQAQESASKQFATKVGSKGEKSTLVKVPNRYENPQTANLPIEIKSGQPIELTLTK